MDLLPAVGGILPGTEGIVEVAVTGVTTAFATTAWRGAEAAPCIWVRALTGDGTAIWVDTTAMTGAETGARAGVGTWTDEGSEAETRSGVELVAAAAAETWGTDLADTGDKAGAGAETCI